MKKVLLTAVFALGTLTAIQAQEKEVEVNVETPEANVEVTTEKDAKLLAQAEAQPVAFKEIKVSELPDAVATAVATDFKGAEVQKAYVNEKNEYKLVLKTATKDAAAKTKTVFASKEGKWLKQQTANM